MSLNQSEVTQVGSDYVNPLLKKILVRIDFTYPLFKPDETVPPKLSKKALELFPIPEAKRVKVGKIEFPKKEEPIKSDFHEETYWMFHGKIRDKRVCIAPEFVYMEYNHYFPFDQILKEFQTIFEEIIAAFPEMQIKRLGLRYINKIERNETDLVNWEKHLKKELLSKFNIVGDQKLIRAFDNLELGYDTFRLIFQYGMHNPDYPAPICKKIFVLDYDAFSEGNLDLSQIRGNLEAFHEKILYFFREVCLTEDYFNEITKAPKNQEDQLDVPEKT